MTATPDDWEEMTEKQAKEAIYRQPSPIFRIADLNEPIWLSLSPSPSSGTLGPGVKFVSPSDTLPKADAIRPGPQYAETLIGWSGSRLTTAAGKEATVAVVGVAGLEARRLTLSRGRAELPLAVAPVLRRRTARAREASTVAVLQTGEGANRIGVGGTQALAPGGLAVAVDLPGASRAGCPAEQDRGGEHGRRCGS